MINGGGVLLVFLSLAIPIMFFFAIISIAVDARAIRRLLERQEASGSGAR
jgi:hypothetical protein